MTEAQYQRRITDLADWLGLRWFHSGDSRRDSCAGYPDLTIVGPGGVLWLEVKTERGRLKVSQAEWIHDLYVAGHRALVARPSTWERVERELRRIARKDHA